MSSANAIIHVDPVVAAARRAQRDRQFHVRDVPRLRLAGFLLLAALVALHHWVAPSGLPASAPLTYLVAVLAYSAVTWSALALLYDRLKPFDLGSAVLGLDLVMFAGAIYASGAERSWLFTVLFLRTADQTPTSLRRVALFAHLAALCYLALMAYVVFVDGRSINWALETVKTISIYIGGLYVALVARTADELRRRTTRVVRLARRLIAQLRRKSSELGASRRRAEQASRAKSAFLANMSHELRTPLNVIIGYSEMLQDDARLAGHRELHDDLAKIGAAGRHLLGLVNQVLDLSKIEAGRFELDVTTFSLAELFEDVRAAARPLVAVNRNALHMAANGAETRVRGDKMKQRQVLLNLLSNAAKFTHDGDVHVSLRRESSVEGDWIEWRVTDNGIGIAPDHLGRLFEEFSQADNSTTRRYGGTGLGLAISQRLCHLMGGTIAVASEANRGTTFTVRLPANLEAAPATGDDRASPRFDMVLTPSS